MGKDNIPNESVHSTPDISARRRRYAPRTIMAIGGAILLAALLLFYAIHDDGDQSTPPPSPEAVLAKEILAMLPQGVERFLITDINNPAASAMPRSRLEEVDDPEVREQIFQLAERYLGMEGLPHANVPSTAPGFINDPVKNYWPGHSTESYDYIEENTFRSPLVHRLSTFSVDVDTASYANVRRFLNEGVLPPPGAVRIEELVNYFDYDYRSPRSNEAFGLSSEVASCPWEPRHRLVRLGLRAHDVDEIPPCNFVFLIDVSGSMRPDNKLPLLKRTLPYLVDRLRAMDSLAIVVYAGDAGLLLPPTRGSHHAAIINAIDSLGASGSTNGAGGIRQAYEVAQRAFIRSGVNRVILATDGDFNVGIADRSQLVELIQEKAREGVFLTVLGVGMGNLKDATLEQLADKGNGNYAYIDSAGEARKVLVQQMVQTLVTVAKDVKVQVEFNPQRVQAYRLIGYENRALAPEDFNNDAKDAGEVGAGHRVTALYEIVPHDVDVQLPDVDPPAFRPATEPVQAASSDLLIVKIRYKAPEDSVSRKQVYHIRDRERDIRYATGDFKFACAVAGYGMLLRRSEFAGELDFGSVRSLAQAGLGDDQWGYRAEFVSLIDTAERLTRQRPAPNRR